MGLVDLRIWAPRNPLAQIIFNVLLALIIGAVLFASLGFREYTESILSTVSLVVSIVVFGALFAMFAKLLR